MGVHVHGQSTGLPNRDIRGVFPFVPIWSFHYARLLVLPSKGCRASRVKVPGFRPVGLGAAKTLVLSIALGQKIIRHRLLYRVWRLLGEGRFVHACFVRRQ